MILVLRIILGLAGLFYLFLGSQFLFNPVEQGADFGLTANGRQGLAAIRSDFIAFFGVTAGSLLIGALRQNGPVLLVAAALMGITMIGRSFSAVVDGTYEAWFVPMIVEGLTVVIALLGYRSFTARS
jgi:hypothetical protein